MGKLKKYNCRGESRMTLATEIRHSPDENIAFGVLFATLRSGKWIIIAVTFMFSVIGVSWAWYNPNVYRASALLAPVEGDGGAGFGMQLGCLASFAGVSIGQDDSNKILIAKEILQSEAFLTDFIHKHHLEIPLMAGAGWDMALEEWIYDRDVYNPETGRLAVEEGKNLASMGWGPIKKFRENHLSVTENNDTGMITVSVKSLSPIAAKNWTKWLVRDINEYMREWDLKEAEANIKCLKKKLQDSSNAITQPGFYQLLKSETRTVMLASIQKEYFFQTVDPAVVPHEESEPTRALIVLSSAMLGGVLSILAVFIRSFTNKPEASGS